MSEKLTIGSTEEVLIRELIEKVGFEVQVKITQIADLLSSLPGFEQDSINVEIGFSPKDGKDSGDCNHEDMTLILLKQQLWNVEIKPGPVICYRSNSNS